VPSTSISTIRKTTNPAKPLSNQNEGGCTSTTSPHSRSLRLLIASRRNSSDTTSHTTSVSLPNRISAGRQLSQHRFSAVRRLSSAIRPAYMSGSPDIRKHDPRPMLHGLSPTVKRVPAPHMTPATRLAGGQHAGRLDIRAIARPSHVRPDNARPNRAILNTFSACHPNRNSL